MKITQVRIFDYTDHRKFLEDCFRQKKLNNPGYSHRVFAKQAGLSSPSHLLMIIRGQRNLSLKTIEKFASGLKLNNKEKRYFELMVLYAQSSDLETKARYFGEIMSLKMSSRLLHDLEKEKFDFLAKWYVVAIYVLLDLKGFKADPQWIVGRLGGRISTVQAEEALATLHKLKLAEISPQGRWRQTLGAITVADDTRAVAVFNYHQSMIRLAADALRLSSAHLREVNGATIAVSKAHLPKLKEKIRAFRKEINQLASSLEDPDEVYQLNIQLFPLTQVEPS